MIDPVIFESLQTKIDEESLVIDVSCPRLRLIAVDGEGLKHHNVMELG